MLARNRAPATGRIGFPGTALLRGAGFILQDRSHGRSEVLRLGRFLQGRLSLSCRKATGFGSSS
jgi:hypothetical protein